MTTSKICAAGDAPVRPWVENERACNLDSIALWTVCLDRDKPSVEGLYRLLSPNERACADRFRFAVDQTRYIVRRGLLRTVLGRSLAVEPGDLVFRNGEFGKPFLSDCSRPRLAFNVSHSNGMAVFAISGADCVGVDLELVRSLPDLDLLMNQCLTVCEIASVRSLSVASQSKQFLRYWTCKEAYLKALGTGLNRGMDSLRVSLTPSGPHFRATVIDSERERTDFVVRSFSPFSGFVAATAAPASCGPPVMMTI